MKNKPVRHKETNRFKFKKFADRISEIDIDVFHRVPHRNEVNSDDEESLESEFSKTLQKWNYQNLTEGYKNLRNEVRHIITLPQLLHHEVELIDSLAKYLSMKDVAFLQPVLELVIAVAKDLQNQFEKHFPRFLKLIINLLDTKDTEILENAFTTLAHLCKTLWKYFVRHIDTTFELLLPLLVDDKPEYVRNFAAESFAFVARKVRDRKSFFQLVLDKLTEIPHSTKGCARLLFEVISGTTSQLHSCAEQMLNLYLTALVNDSIDNKLSFNLLHEIFNCITEQISPKNSQIFWSVVLKTIDENSKNDPNEMNQNMIKNLMHLLRLVVDYRGGKMLIDPISLSTRIVKTISIYQNYNEVLKEILDLGVSILLANQVKLGQETSHELIIKIIGIDNRQSLIYAIEKLVNHPSFESTILPRALHFSILKDNFDQQELRLFCKIILERVSFNISGDGLHENWRKIDLDLRKFPRETIDFIRNILNPENSEISPIEDIVRTIIILPHVKPTTEKLIESLKGFFQSLYRKLINEEDIGNTMEEGKLCLVLLLALKSIIHLMDVQSFKKWMDTIELNLQSLMERYSHSLHIINFVDLFLTHMSMSEYNKDYIKDDILTMVDNHLGGKLTCPDRRVRLALCHIYSLFTNVPETQINLNAEGPHAFEIIYKAEMVNRSVNIDRDRLLHLQALSFESRALANLSAKYHGIAVRFLLGNFYINFSPLWTPLSQIIATFATEECEQFWQVFLEELTRNNRAFIRNRLNEVAHNDNCENYFNCDILRSWQMKSALDDKPDYENYKICLWKCMREFTAYCEKKNRDITGLFIDFVQNNVFRGNTETSRSFSITKRIEDTDKIDQVDEDSEEKPEKIGKSSNYKLLIAQLQFFSKLQNPKTLYREPELNKIFIELLTSKSLEIQKSALDCIFAYKNKNLHPYKDNLSNLIDEKNLRNELARFKIANDENEGQSLQPDDREVLMPILLRLLYAKMITRGTGRASTGDGALVRRKIILRFLMGIQEKEMMIFAKMAFKLSVKYGISFNSEDPLPDLTILTSNIINDIDLSNVIPPKRLRSMVNLLGIVIEDFGAKMSKNLLPRLLAILVSILAHVKGILDRSTEVLSGFLPVLKEVRTTAIGIVARFFSHFENYNWSATELDALFNVGIFPWIVKLPYEGVFSPTTLLKLIAAWCQNPRYFCLLVKHQQDNSSISCLPYVVKLLLEERTHPSVVTVILEMIEKLLTLKDYDPENTMDVDDFIPAIPLQPTNILQVNTQAVLPGFDLNYGSAILLPHVPDILAFIERKFKKSKTGINRTETTILARISELNLDSNTSNQLISLSLPILVKRASRGESEDIILQLLETIVNFVKTIDNPEIHVRSILPLLLSISFNSGRQLLVQLLETIVSRMQDSSTVPKDVLVKSVDIIKSLNAMNQRWIEQVDFEKRLDAYSAINTLVTSDSDALTIEFGVAVLYNSFYSLKHETDLALKDSAAQCLNVLGPKLAKLYKENADDRRYLIEDTMLNLIRNGIKSKNDNEKMSSIAFLGIMSTECSDVHPVFRDLHPLTDKVDLEVDFFENLRHLQLHRKVRALLKFCNIAKTLKKAPNTKTLTQFIFPLASYYLCNESFVGKNTLVDAAIEAVGTVCRLLPWHQYAMILKYYMDKLRMSSEFQRQIVRIVVSILDAFHYDLSKATAMSTITIPTSKDIKEDENNDDTVEVEGEMENLEEKLATQPDEDDAEVDEGQLEKVDDDTIMNKQTVLSQSAAQRVIIEIKRHHIMKLNRAILASTQHQISHKSNHKRTAAETEEQELTRVPIALALVKLLQKLPHEILKENLPGIFMKLCTFLKSRLMSVRLATREILQKIMITLGPDYLHVLLREMNSLLTKGFQIHVLAFTIHAVLTTLKDTKTQDGASSTSVLKPEHMNANLQSILAVCKVDLFGLSAEEKEIGAITKNTNEAKATKSFDMFHIMALFISESCLLDLIQPLSVVLKQTRSHKTVAKVTECLRHTILGLADNQFIPNDKLLIFLYGVMSQSIPGFNSTLNDTKNDKTKQLVEKTDCFIIPPEPKSRMGMKTAVSKTADNTNDHVLVEFGLKLLHVLLKRKKLSGEILQTYLDPFIPILAECIKSQHVKLSTSALLVLNVILPMDTKSIKSNIKDICASVFEILHKFGSAGLSKGDNFDLVMAAFKTMSTLVRDVEHFNFSHDQMIVLISYAEQDLYDHERQATAFKLIKAIIGRKFPVKDMKVVMNKVASLSVTSESNSVRQQCRMVFHYFLSVYNLKKKELDYYIELYVAQLKYETPMGRLSALEMMCRIVDFLNERVENDVTQLEKRAGFLFVMIGLRLINDDDPACRELVANCIEKILTHSSHNKRIELFDIVTTWFKDDKLTHRFLAAQLCGIFPNIEKEAFESRLEKLLPLILKQFITENDDDDDESKQIVVKKSKKRKRNHDELHLKDPERLKDHHLISVLQLTLKVSMDCPGFLKKDQYIGSVKCLAEHCQKLLQHPHMWVRLAALKQMEFILASIDECKVMNCLERSKQIIEDGHEEDDEDSGFVYTNPVRTLTKLSFDLISQLYTEMEMEEFDHHVVRNLVFIAKFVKSMTWKIDNTPENNGDRISITWLMKKIRKRINMEVTQCPKSISVRTAAFKWIVAIIAKIDINPYLQPILFQMLSPIVREMLTTEVSNAPLRQMAKEAAKMIKNRIGDEVYTRLLGKVQQKLNIKRAERKKIRVQEFVTAPELAAKRKIAKQKKKPRKKRRVV